MCLSVIEKSSLFILYRFLARRQQNVKPYFEKMILVYGIIDALEDTMSKSGKTKNITARIRPKNRQQKEKRNWIKAAVKKNHNTRIRRISKHR